MLAPILIRES